MHDIEELKRYVVTHARAQGIPVSAYRTLLQGISSDDRGMPGSWVWVWSRAAEQLERKGKLLEACRYFNMARFPYADEEARECALDRCITAFDRWRSDHDIHRLDVELPGGRVRCWTSGLSQSEQRPVLLVTGGIISIKEQWAPMLRRIRRAGMAGIVTEMPGVGENTLRYGPDSWRMLSAVLDSARSLADVSQVYALALSFSGHLALRSAVDDHRIRGIIAAGAPVSEFFTDAAWQQQLPRITVDTLCHLTGTKAGKDFPATADWALTPRQLAALEIPVCVMESKRDEIIPAGDALLLQQHVRDLRLIRNDDVHGSPRHVAESKLWVALSLLAMRGSRGPQHAVLGALLHTLRARPRMLRAAS